MKDDKDDYYTDKMRRTSDDAFTFAKMAAVVLAFCVLLYAAVKVVSFFK